MASSTAGSSTVEDVRLVTSSCTFTEILDTNSCYVRRSCASCFQHEACMVNEVGICVDKATGSYNPAMDFRIAQELNLVFPAAADTNASTEQRWHFPDATYCDTSDVVCKQCRDARYWALTTSDIDSRYCIGEGGCICISMCDSPTWGESIPKQCINGSPVSESDISEPGSSAPIGGILMVLFLTVSIIGGCVCCVRCAGVVGRTKQREEKGDKKDEELPTPVPEATTKKRESVAYVSIKGPKEEVTSVQHMTASGQTHA